MVEKAKGLLRGRGCEANDRGVKIVQHLPPQIVDGAMTLIRDDEIEALDGDVWIVGDGRRLALQSFKGESGLFFQRRIKLLLPLQHRVKTLNRGDADFADAV